MDKCVLCCLIWLFFFLPHTAASSTTGPDHVKQDKEGSGNDASSWSVDDVIQFVQEADPYTLGPHVELFRKHVSTLLFWSTDNRKTLIFCLLCLLSHQPFSSVLKINPFFTIKLLYLVIGFEISFLKLIFPS